MNFHFKIVFKLMSKFEILFLQLLFQREDYLRNPVSFKEINDSHLLEIVYFKNLFFPILRYIDIEANEDKIGPIERTESISFLSA